MIPLAIRFLGKRLCRCPDYTLSRNPFGKLVLTLADGFKAHEGVVPVRAFPIAAPDDGVGMISTDGRELAWIPRLDALPAPMRALIEAELAARSSCGNSQHCGGVDLCHAERVDRHGPIVARPTSCCAEKRTSGD